MGHHRNIKSYLYLFGVIFFRNPVRLGTYLKVPVIYTDTFMLYANHIFHLES